MLPLALVCLSLPPAPLVPDDRAATFTSAELTDIPRPSDPWSLLREVPGVVVDRVNVGGSETAQQSLLVSHGDGGAGATWSLDGVDVTDPAALGSSSFFPDLDALGSVRVRTSGQDVRVRTPGVQVELRLREPGDRFAGRAHLRAAGDPLQSDNLPAELEGRPFFRNRTERVWEMGGEAGGPLRGGRLWLWGAAARNALRQETFTEHTESLRTTSLIAKASLRLGPGEVTLLGLRGEKVHEDRDTGFTSSPESRWRQSGPVHLLSLEGSRPWRGTSVRARVSYLDAGFRLEPQGGTQPSAFEDFRGVLQRSYQSFATDRPRAQLALEGERNAHGFGFAHALRAGGGLRRSVVRTFAHWPGNGILALERQSVFFRTFRLTGFALPTRDQEARSVQTHAEAYLQDDLRRGRLGLVLGLRFDRLGGRNLDSTVEANPELPGELPAVGYGGGPTRIRWTDLLPRASASWTLGRTVARASYAAYGAALGTAEVTFDNPIGREVATLTYYWIDRNGDHVVQASELDRVRGRLASSGVSPQDPASTVSPHLIAPGLRAPRTHEVALGLDHAWGSAGRAGVSVSWRRLQRPLWRPLRNLTLADYQIRGAVRGELFGEDYSVGYYAPASESRLVPGFGRLLANRDGYRQDTFATDFVAEGALRRSGSWRAWLGLTDWRESFPEPDLALQDPTPLENEPLQDQGVVAARGGGLGRADVFVNARWAGGLCARAALPRGLRASTVLYARDGFPIPYFEVASTGDPTSGAKNVLVSPHLDSYRLPALVLLDVRLERGFAAGPGTLTASLDVFNLLNAATRLQVARDVDLPAFNRPRELVRPRLARVGLAYRF